MRVYWIDTGVLIQSRHRYYPMHRQPTFWGWVDKQLEAGTIRMPERVYAEIVKGTDWLALWTEHRKNKGLCVYPDDSVYESYGIVADCVEAQYRDRAQKDKALSGADLWVIAHARAK